VSEFKLAEDLNITVNQIRNMLYRLHKHNLVSFIRKKDKKKGWYIYYWTLNLNNTKDTLLNYKKQQLEDFKARLEREQSSTFYVCPNRCRRYPIETAMEMDFRCEECGELVLEQNNSRTILNIKERIKELEAEVANAEMFEAKKFAKHGEPKRVRATGSTKVAKSTTKNVAKKSTTKKVAKKTAKKVAKKTAKKAAKKSTTKKVAKKTAKKVAKKSTTKKVAKKTPAKKVAKKSTTKKAAKKTSAKKVAKKSSLLKKVLSRVKK
ncbi:hypothetical protein D6777_02905, partial [Candidatus Woesearchaeota archaeon]